MLCSSQKYYVLFPIYVHAQPDPNGRSPDWAFFCPSRDQNGPKQTQKAVRLGRVAGVALMTTVHFSFPKPYKPSKL